MSSRRARRVPVFLGTVAMLFLVVGGVAACAPGQSSDESPPDASDDVPDAGTSAPDAGDDAPDAGNDAPDGGSSSSKKRIFRTSQQFTGNLKAAGQGATGLAGGDNLCQQAAEAANLGGAWKAWLSDSSTNAIDRIADVGPWYLVGAEETKVFNNKAHLGQIPLVPINRTEFGAVVGNCNGSNCDEVVGSMAWTGTMLGGTVALAGSDALTCSDWTTDSYEISGGYGLLSPQLWTYKYVDDCQQSPYGFGLYCIEQ